MEIVDAQIHIWAEETSERPWNLTTGHAPHGPKSYSAEMSIEQMNAAGVAAAFVVPPSFEGNRNDVIIQAAQRYPTRMMGHGRWDVSSSRFAEKIAQEIQNPRLRGIRLTFNGEAAHWIEEGVVEWVWQFAEERAIPVTLFPVVADLAEFAPILQRYPKLKLSLDHLGTSVPQTGYDTFQRIEQLAALANFPNVAVKVSALPISFPKTYSPNLVRELIDKLLHWFEPRQLFWGSDYTRYPTETYGETVGQFIDGIAHLEKSDQELIMGMAVREWFSWKVLE